MSIRPAGLLLIPFAAVCLVAAACSSDLAGPDGERRASARRGTAIPDSGVACSDSVVAGYGNCCTGGLDYTTFEYDPATGTEYVCSDDPAAACKGLVASCDTTVASPPPPPPPPPAPPAPPTTSPTPVPTSPTPTR